jgi:hypothetical protein
MQPFNQYITGAEASVARVELERLVGHYEWFTAARRARTLLYGVTDSRLELSLVFAPTISPVVSRPEEIVVGAAQSEEVQADGSAEDAIIDRFLGRQNLRITPDSAEAEVADSVVEGSFDAEFATEELAEIYRSQGLYAEAREIYRQLSLLNPEKSIYFADVIARIEKEIIN